jgi:hypothetical protein
MHRLAYFNRGLITAMIADTTASFRYQASRTPSLCGGPWPKSRSSVSVYSLI